MKKIAISMCFATAILVFCIHIHFWSEVSAQSPGSESETAAALQQRINTFFESIIEPSGSSSAYHAMFVGTQPPEAVFQKMIQETDNLTKTSRWKFEHIDTKRIGSDLISIRYLYKSDTHPVVWYFTFYRSQTLTRPSDSTTSASSWNCIGVKFDTDLDSLFKESWPK
jgi:hypothetical protein